MKPISMEAKSVKIGEIHLKPRKPEKNQRKLRNISENQ
jgi:hypothetical protein